MEDGHQEDPREGRWGGDPKDLSYEIKVGEVSDGSFVPHFRTFLLEVSFCPFPMGSWKKRNPWDEKSWKRARPGRRFDSMGSIRWERKGGGEEVVDVVPR